MEKKISYFLNNIENILGSISSILMIVFLSIQVISRYVFGSPIQWTEELALITFISSIYFGAVGAWQRSQHLRLAILTDKLGPRNKLYLRLVSNTFVKIFCIAIIPALNNLVLSNYKTKMKLPVTLWPKWIFYTVLPIMFGLMIIRVLQEDIKIIKALKNNTPFDPNFQEDLEVEEINLDEEV